MMTATATTEPLTPQEEEKEIVVPLKATPSQSDEPQQTGGEEDVVKKPTPIIVATTATTTTMTTAVDLESTIARAQLMAKVQLAFEIGFLCFFQVIGLDAAFGIVGACIAILSITRNAFVT